MKDLTTIKNVIKTKIKPFKFVELPVIISLSRLSIKFTDNKVSQYLKTDLRSNF
jgi:hypothetical protein